MHTETPLGWVNGNVHAVHGHHGAAAADTEKVTMRGAIAKTVKALDVYSFAVAAFMRTIATSA
jgi:hypothetical protein